MLIDQILNKFSNVKQEGQYKYKCTCPCHRDKKPSLSITHKGNKTLIYCFAGCSTINILSSVGLTIKNLFDNEDEYKKELSWTENAVKGCKFDTYYDYGKYIKVRAVDKDNNKVIRYGHTVKQNENTIFKNGMPEKVEKTLYNIKALDYAKSHNLTVYYVEGEKDVETLKQLGLSAVTAGGVNDWKAEFAFYFKGLNVVILNDNDEAGMKLAQKVQYDLQDTAFATKIVQTSGADKGDVTDYISEGHTKEELLQLVKSIGWRYANFCNIDNDGNYKGINADLLACSISKYNHFIRIQDTIYYYNDNLGVYEALSMLDYYNIASEYIPENKAKTRLLGETYNLTLARKKYCKPFKNADIFTYNRANEKYINCRNGILNIMTGELEPHTPDKYFLNYIDIDYISEPKRVEAVDKFFNDITLNDKLYQNYIFEVIGILISNYSIFEKVKGMFILYSECGNSGKSTFLDIIKALMKNNFYECNIQELKERFVASCFFDKGIITCDDNTAYDIQDSSYLKRLTGNADISVEFKCKTPFQAKFGGGIIFACNNVPVMSDDKGQHMADRLNIMPFQRVFTAKEIDKNLKAKLTQPEALQYIFSLALKGLKRLISNNFSSFNHNENECKQVKQAREEYQRKSDTLYHYISENYIITGDSKDRISAVDFDNAYVFWCVKNERKPILKSNIKDRMAGLNIIKRKARHNNSPKWCYLGIKEKDFAETDEDLPEEFKNQNLEKTKKPENSQMSFINYSEKVKNLFK